MTGVFSPVSGRARAGRRASSSREVLGDDIAVSLSHEIGSLGLIERENATVLNAALRAVAREVAAALEQSLADHGLAPTVFFAQNDGTLMALDYAIRYPVLTIGSGPGQLAARRRVPDRAHATRWWPTSAAPRPTSACSSDGFPRESAAAVEIGGVRTNFRMPDLVAIALGGGSDRARRRRRVALGPDSVGFGCATRRSCSAATRRP